MILKTYKIKLIGDVHRAYSAHENGDYHLRWFGLWYLIGCQYILDLIYGFNGNGYLIVSSDQLDSTSIRVEHISGCNFAINNIEKDLPGLLVGMLLFLWCRKYGVVYVTFNKTLE